MGKYKSLCDISYAIVQEGKFIKSVILLITTSLSFDKIKFHNLVFEDILCNIRIVTE